MAAAAAGGDSGGSGGGGTSSSFGFTAGVCFRERLLGGAMVSFSLELELLQELYLEWIAPMQRGLARSSCGCGGESFFEGREHRSCAQDFDIYLPFRITISLNCLLFETSTYVTNASIFNSSARMTGLRLSRR